MADTHINAYYIDVEDAKQALDLATAEYEAAKTRLHDKEVELGIDEEKVSDDKEKHNSHKTSVFSKK